MNVERLLLTALASVAPRLITRQTLWAELRLDAPDASYTDFESALRHLAEKKQITLIPGEDRDRVKILAAGQARLAE